MAAKNLPPVHPGEVLLEEFLQPLGISQNRLARDLAVPAQRINDIVRVNRAVTVDTALRLARYFHTTPQFWLNLQMHYDLEMARKTQLVDRVNRDVRTNEALEEAAALRGSRTAARKPFYLPEPLTITAG
jgi:addiction module HigA family antidote